MNLYYETTDSGYYIKDHDNEFFILHQYEPYIPYRTTSYAESAQKHIEMILNPPKPSNRFNIPDEIYSDVLKDITSTIKEGVLNNV